jgi:hypothetical protein
MTNAGESHTNVSVKITRDRYTNKRVDTFVAVADDIKVEGIVVVFEAHPGRKGIDGHHEQDAHNPQLVVGVAVVLEVLVDQMPGYQDRQPGEHASNGKARAGRDERHAGGRDRLHAVWIHQSARGK